MRVKKTIDPVTSNWGFKLWTLLLFEDEIVAWPYTYWESAVFGATRRSAPRVVCSNEEIDEAEQRERIFRYPMKRGSRVVLRSKHGRNAVEIHPSTGPAASYGIWYRRSTRSYGEDLRKLYGEKFEEASFPISRLGRTLRW